MSSLRYKLNNKQIHTYQSIDSEEFAETYHSFNVVSPSVISPNATDPILLPPPMSLSESIISPSATSRHSWSDDQQSAYSANLSVMRPSHKRNLFNMLQGNWETDQPQAIKIQVVLSVQDSQQYAIVRRWLEWSWTKEIPDYLIYDEDTRFSLCSQDGFVKAVIMKRMIEKNTLNWYTNDGTRIVWRRAVSEVPTPNKSRRNSTASQFSRTSMMSGSRVNQSQASPTASELGIQELLSLPSWSPENQQTLFAVPDLMFEKRVTAIASARSSSKADQNLSDDALFALFKAQCTKYPKLQKRVLN